MARQRFSSTYRVGRIGRGIPSSYTRARCATRPTVSDEMARLCHASVCASQMRISTVPKRWCGRTDHQICVNSWMQLVSISSS